MLLKHTTTFDSVDQREARQRQLVDYVERQGFLSVGEIEAAVGISTATIRRDLAELEKKGRIRRIRGGATPVDLPAWRRSDSERTIINLAEKVAIASAAENLILQGERVMIDSGTTTIEFARFLAKRHDLTILTNGLGIAQVIESAHHPRFILVGGEFHAHNRSFAGASTCRAIEDFHVDTAVLCTAGIDLDLQVITMPDLAMAETQRSMIRSAGRTIVLADHSKFRNPALCVVSSLKSISAVVTDDDMEADLESRITAAGSRLIRAGQRHGGAE